MNSEPSKDSEIEQKPCPFCGCSMLEAGYRESGMISRFIYCTECLAQGPNTNSVPGAWAEWNARAQLATDQVSSNPLDLIEIEGVAYKLGLGSEFLTVQDACIAIHGELSKRASERAKMISTLNAIAVRSPAVECNQEPVTSTESQKDAEAAELRERVKELESTIEAIRLDRIEHYMGSWVVDRNSNCGYLPDGHDRWTYYPTAQEAYKALKESQK